MLFYGQSIQLTLSVQRRPHISQTTVDRGSRNKTGVHKISAKSFLEANYKILQSTLVSKSCLILTTSTCNGRPTTISFQTECA
jgi:ubiquitin C-terminal hydrolase